MVLAPIADLNPDRSQISDPVAQLAVLKAYWQALKFDKLRRRACILETVGPIQPLEAPLEISWLFNWEKGEEVINDSELIGNTDWDSVSLDMHPRVSENV